MAKQLARLILCSLPLAACGHAAAPPPGGPDNAPPAGPVVLSVTPIDLPGGDGPDGALMDYLACDQAHGRVWVPAGNTGKVDVIDVATGALTSIDGFKTQEMERHGKKRTVGPSSATVAGDIVYVGNRGDFSVCAFDATTLAKGACATLDAMPDGLQYVASKHEVWVTTPRDKSIRVLDAAAGLVQTARLPFDGEPEGFAVDDARGVFYTNLEDMDKTLAIDLGTRAVTHTWEPACGEDGPKGLALDHAADVLIVACADHVVALDAGHDGALLSKLDTGDGVDAIDYVEPRHELFVAAARAAKITVATMTDRGVLTALATTATADGARNAVASSDGTAYVADTPQGKVLVVSRAAP